ncbi:MAG: hypothetical protein RL095_3711 [Verrucomicrobiota bacterium]|jgi:hypothetical protein
MTNDLHHLIPCPCCSERTLSERAAFEICPRCHWEDNGQDDANADVVSGGPNGSLSLSQAFVRSLSLPAACSPLGSPASCRLVLPLSAV